MKLTSSPRRNSSITSRPLSVPSAASASCAVVRDDHAFARRQAVGFQHHRKAETVERLARIGLVFDGDELRRGDVTLYKEVLCENLTAFELRGVPVRSHDLPPARPERIHHPRHQGRFRPDHRQIRADGFRHLEIGGARHNRQARPDFARCPDCPAPQTPIPPATAPVSTPARARALRCPGPEFSFRYNHINAREVRRRGRRRRSRRVRSRARLRAHGSAHRHGHHEPRPDRADVVQPRHRRHRQGPPGARDRRPRRRHGRGRRRRRHPVPPAQHQPRPGRLVAARADGQEDVPRPHARGSGAGAQPAHQAGRSGRAYHSRTAASRAFSCATAAPSRPAP